MKKLLLVCVLTLITGCGHNMYFEHGVWGIDASFPCGDGNRIGVTIGASKDVIAAVRGGATFETTSSSGGGLMSTASGGNRLVQFKSNLQFNEGNMLDAMMSPNVPDDAKRELAKAVKEASVAPVLEDAVLSTREASAYIGENAVKSNAVNSVYNKTGIDLVIDKTPEVIQSVTDPVVKITTNATSTVSSVVHDAVNPLEGTVDAVDGVVKDVGTVVDNVGGVVQDVNKTVNELGLTLEEVKEIVLVLALAICAMLIIILLYRIFSKKSKHKSIDVNGHIDELVDGKVIQVPPTTNGTASTAEDGDKKDNPYTSGKGKAPLIRMTFLRGLLMVLSLLRFIPPKTKQILLDKIKELWIKHKKK